MPDEERREAGALPRGDRFADPPQERDLALVRRQPLGDVIQVVLPAPADELVDSHDPHVTARIDTVLDFVHIHAIRIAGQRTLMPGAEVDLPCRTRRVL